MKHIQLFALSILSASMLYAAEIMPFSKAAFEKAQNDNKTIVLDYKASWCGTCKKQGKSIKALRQGALKNNKDIVFLTVDYDDKKLKKTLPSEHQKYKQSTLVLYKGSKHIATERGTTSEQGIADFIAKANEMPAKTNTPS